MGALLVAVDAANAKPEAKLGEAGEPEKQATA
jgi:hypothetical protein